jgi:iron-sulfur cluster repair protein YtfE (RIC family)
MHLCRQASLYRIPPALNRQRGDLKSHMGKSCCMLFPLKTLEMASKILSIIIHIQVQGQLNYYRAGQVFSSEIPQPLRLINL